MGERPARLLDVVVVTLGERGVDYTQKTVHFGSKLSMRQCTLLDSYGVDDSGVPQELEFRKKSAFDDVLYNRIMVSIKE